MQFANKIQANQGTLTVGLSSRQSPQKVAEQQNLVQGQIQTIQAHPGLVVRAMSGVLWLTQQGDTQDIILRPGQQWAANRAGRVVVQALGGDANWTMHEATKRSPRWLHFMDV